MNKTTIIVIIILLLAGAGIIWGNSSSKKSPDVISLNGIHWHPELEIFVKGEKIEIPENIGLVGVHSPIHTHDDLPLIHLEFSDKVTKSDIMLGVFFKVWGKDFYEFGEQATMTVNGEENTEFENYEMQDGDKIILRYE